MKLSVNILAILLGLAVASCSQLDGSKASASVEDASPAAVPRPDDDDEEDVSLDQVPAAAKQAALDEVAGLVLESAEKETEDGSLHYCIHGTANGVAYEIEVSPQGDVLEVEEGDDDDEDEDGDDD